MKKRMQWYLPLAALVALLTGVAPVQAALEPGNQYHPSVTAAEFTTTIDNPYFAIPVGKKLVYEAETPEGLERIEILVPGWTREVMGVETLVFWDRVYVDGRLIEDTRDYVAQHKVTGDVWYFGEHVDNYENGKLIDHEGMWIGGVDGAQPGIWFSGNPQKGLEYRQEYYAGKAEDAARVESVGETVTVPAGTFTDCVKVLEYSPLFTATAHKYHCREAGGTALEIDLPDSPDMPNEQRTELVAVDMQGALRQQLPAEYQKEGVVAGVAGVAADEPGEEESEEGKDRDFFGDREEADGPGAEREDNDFLVAGVAGVVGLLVGIGLQKYVLNRPGKKAGSSN